MSIHRRLFHSFSVIVVLTMLFSGIASTPVSAQGPDGLERQVNAQTGKVSFLGPKGGQALPAADALGKSTRPQDPAMALAKRFGQEFGLQDPERQLAEVKNDRAGNGRITARYQQTYQGIPILGAELIVNTNDSGDLYSMNGEVSSKVSLSTQPAVTPEQARDLAVQAVAKWYGKNQKDFKSSSPELWIYDENLLRPSTRPAELTWRIEVMSGDAGLPVRELVLVDAQRGSISLHFNQIDTAWSSQGSSGTIQDPDPTSTPVPTGTPLAADTPSVVETPGTVLPTETTAPAEQGSPAGAVAGDSELDGAIWYVATTGNNSSSCSAPASPCATINGALGKATANDTIRVALGTYTGTGTEVVRIEKNITLSGGWNAAFSAQSGRSVIDAQESRGGVLVNAAPNVMIDRFTIRNGTVGLRNASGTVTLNNILVTANFDGGIYNYGTMTINNSLITENFAKSACCSGGGGGAGIESSGSLTLNNSTVSRNTLRGGHSGSGISAFGGLVLNNSTVIANTGGYGEGIHAWFSTTVLNNSTITGNESVGIGILSGTLTLQNTIIAGNGSAGDCRTDPTHGGMITSQGYNLIGTVTGCPFTPTTGDLVNVNPKLGQLIGFPGTMLLASDSPAIDKGNPAIPGSSSSACLVTDQRGVARPVGARCDIGAYEYAAPGAVARLVVQSGDEQRSGSNMMFARPLAIAALDGQGSPVSGVTVTFTAPASGASGLFTDTHNRITTAVTNADGIATASSFTSNSQMGAYTVAASAIGVSTINFNLQNKAWFVATGGSNSNSCAVQGSPCATIDGALGKASRGDIIQIAVGEFTGAVEEGIFIDGKVVTLSGGWNAAFTTQSGLSTINGQGVRSGLTTDSDANVTIDHFRVRNAVGAGIYNYYSVMVLNNSLITENNSVGILNHGRLTVNETTISNNTGGDPCCVGGGGGGGIDNSTGTLIMNNSLVSGNKLLGGFSGPGIYSGPGTVILNNSTVTGNTGGDGAGISTFLGKITLRNSTITFNETSGVDSDGTLTIQNTILAGNGGGGDCINEGSVVSLGYNLIGNGTSCPFTPAAGDQVGTRTQPIGARLAPLQDNGGPTLTHALMTSSPAIDAGNPAAPGSSGAACLVTDQRGVSRPVAGRCDIGAYEGSVPWVPVPLVNTYHAWHSDTLPGVFVCSQADPNCAAGDAHAKAAHKYAIGTYNFYASQFLRDSIDNAGMVITSSVHYCDPDFPCPYANAFWNGEQMVYGDAYGFPLADDVVAHELTHGVTEHESNLFYYYQSGAINESFSDLWGEYYDQMNGLGTDTPAVKWLHGEDVSGHAISRSMSNPPAYHDPDKISSPYYYEGEEDSGGVHSNSGVNNKAVYLMVDGGTFNGITVSALGWEKTTAIYYEVNTKLLTSGADYSDLYYAVQQACTNLVGQKGITAADCVEVRDALVAVEMYGQPAGNFNTDAPYCTVAGTVPNIVFADDLESGVANWTFSNGAYPRWQWDSPFGDYAQSGLHSLYADDYPDVVTDATARLKSLVIPGNAYLHFAHAYDFEQYQGVFYDGGVLEYSINGGSTWLDAAPLIDFNRYKGTIYAQYNNPLRGRAAFVGSSHGYISTRLNLASLAGRTVLFRWRMGLDGAIPAWGWWVDNLKLYTCGLPLPGAFNKTSPANAAMDRPTNTILSWGASSGATSYQVCYDTTNDNACANWVSNGAFTSRALNGLLPGTTYYWQVRSVNNSGTTYANGSPTAFWSFRTMDPPGAFNKTSPANGSSGVGLNTSLSWSSSSNAASYQYCYDLVDDNQCNRTWGSTTTPSVDISNLGTNTTYYWQVRAVNAVGTTYADGQGWGNFTTTATLPAGMTGIEAFVGTTKQGKYSLGDGQSLRESYTGVNNGPVKIASTGSTPLIAAERLIYKVNNANTSFTEMMGLPASQLDTTYWLPWYNNADLDTQLRIANVSGTPATVHVYIGGVEMQGSPFPLAAGESTRKSFAGVNAGPVQIVSDQNIVAAERLIYKVNNVATSFTEMMALPSQALDTTYWLPWYNNKDLDTQLRFANVTDQPASVHVYIGGVEMQGSPFPLAAGESTRKSFPGINNGPVKIVSDQNIVAAERLIYKVNNVATSFTEMMALPNSQLDTTYWLPWYNNKDLDTQLRFANVHDTQTATVHVYIGGTEMPNSPFTLLPGESTRQSFVNINNGPVQIVSNVPIVAAERLIYKVNNVATSFSEMMALPHTQLDTTYWLPWYNNLDLDTQLRFGVP